MSQPQAPGDYAIETRGLTKYYSGRPVVHALDLKIPVGCVYGAKRRGQIDDDPHADRNGRTRFRRGPRIGRRRGRLVARHARPSRLYRRGASAVWLDDDRRIERFTRPFYPRWNKSLFDQIVEHFDLPRKKKLRRFSNGQRAQVSLALAVAPDPELLILDDPTLGLDTVVRRDFLESLIQIIQRSGRTILFSSHILGDVERVADRIGIMVDGFLRVDCPTEHFKQALRKIVLEFAGPPKPFPKMEGIVSDCVVGHRRELVIANYSDAHRDAAEALAPVSIDVLELNLEDAFIEYTRGQKRSLPVFDGGGEPNVQGAGVQGAA